MTWGNIDLECTDSIFQMQSRFPSLLSPLDWSEWIFKKNSKTLHDTTFVWDDLLSPCCLGIVPVVVSDELVLVCGLVGRNWRVPSVFNDVGIRLYEHGELQILSLIHLHRQTVVGQLRGQLGQHSNVGLVCSKGQLHFRLLQFSSKCPKLLSFSNLHNLDFCFSVLPTTSRYVVELLMPASLTPMQEKLPVSPRSTAEMVSMLCMSRRFSPPERTFSTMDAF